MKKRNLDCKAYPLVREESDCRKTNQAQNAYVSRGQALDSPQNKKCRLFPFHKSLHFSN